jgi:uncharacterized protein
MRVSPVTATDNSSREAAVATVTTYPSRKERTMSEQANEAVVRGIYDSFLRGDLPAVLEALTEDVEWSWYGPGELPFAGTWTGREAVAKWFGVIADTVEFRHFNPTDFEFVAQGETVVVLGYEQDTARRTGRQFDQQWVQFLTIRDGKVARFRQFPDTAAVDAAFASA